jgi:hypothetical protein
MFGAFARQFQANAGGRAGDDGEFAFRHGRTP